jgi:hypothetical protein
MSKRITTRWYVGAWLVWLIALAGWLVMGHSGPSGATGTPPAAALLTFLVMAVAGLVMLVTWIGALIRLGQRRTWGWFAGVLILHLVGLGIVGMVAYAIAGPDDIDDVAIRPRRSIA